MNTSVVFPALLRNSPKALLEPMNLHGKSIYALISGSSRGFGKSIANAFLSSVLPHSPRSVTLTLHSTPASKNALIELRSQLMQRYSDPSTDLKMNTFLRDFERLPDSKAVYQAMSAAERPTHAFLFNNSGILIPSPVNSMDMSDLQKTMSVNVSAMCQMAQVFITTFSRPTSKYVIHTTSLAALQPFASWGAYCMSKAATDMMHRVLAHENLELRVLQYAPGPLHTDMLHHATADNRCDASLADHFIKMRGDKTVISPETSAAKLMAVLLADDFNSGDHIDFYDI